MLKELSYIYAVEKDKLARLEQQDWGNNGSEGKDEFYHGDLNDVTQLIRLLHHQYPYAFIHMVGFSRGGLQGLLTFQDLPVNSYIIWGGVSDIFSMYEETCWFERNVALYGWASQKE